MWNDPDPDPDHGTHLFRYPTPFFCHPEAFPSFSSCSRGVDGDGDKLTKGGAILLGSRRGGRGERDRGCAAVPESRPPPPAMALPVPLVRLALLLLVALPFCAAHPGPGAFPAPRHFQSPALHSGSCRPPFRVSYTCFFFTLFAGIYVADKKKIACLFF